LIRHFSPGCTASTDRAADPGLINRRRLEQQRVRHVTERQIERPGDPCRLDTDAARVDRRRSRSDAEPADHVRRDVALILIEVAEVDQVPRPRLIENSFGRSPVPSVRELRSDPVQATVTSSQRLTERRARPSPLPVEPSPARAED
jgi:hypothetical protein